MKKAASRGTARVVSTGKKPPKDGVTKPNVPKKTKFQKEVDKKRKY